MDFDSAILSLEDFVVVADYMYCEFGCFTGGIDEAKQGRIYQYLRYR